MCQQGKGFAGPVEVDQTYLGGKRRNMPSALCKELRGRGPVAKTATVGAKDRATKQVAAKVVRATDKATLQGFVQDHADRQARVYPDDASACETLPFEHESVKHSVSEYVSGESHTNGVESFWSMLTRGCCGMFHNLDPNHRDCYVQEFSGRLQPARAGHRRHDGRGRAGHGRQAALVRGSDPGQRSGSRGPRISALARGTLNNSNCLDWMQRGAISAWS